MRQLPCVRQSSVTPQGHKTRHPPHNSYSLSLSDAEILRSTKCSTNSHDNLGSEDSCEVFDYVEEYEVRVGENAVTYS